MLPDFGFVFAGVHEAGHAVVADSLGVRVGAARINQDGTGVCTFPEGKVPGRAAAVILVAGVAACGLWLDAEGQDRRMALLGAEGDLEAFGRLAEGLSPEVRRRTFSAAVEAAERLLAARWGDVWSAAAVLVAEATADRETADVAA